MITPSFGLTATERVLPKLALDFTTASLDSRIAFTRTTGASNPATYVGSNGYITAATNNQPRFDYDPVTLACKGLLIEESRANAFTYSNTFSDASWTKSNLTPTASSVTSPSGTTDAWTFTGTGLITSTYVYKSAASANTYTMSFYVRAKSLSTFNMQASSAGNGRLCSYDLSTGIPGTPTVLGTGGTVSSASATMTAVGNGWYRCTFTFTQSGTNFAFLLMGTGTLDVYGAQLEAGAFATSYIPTTTTALTRNADVAVMTGTNFSSWWTATTGSMLVCAQQKTVGGTRPWTQFDDNTTNNIIVLRGNTTNPELYIKATTDQTQIDAGTIAVNTSYGLTGAWNTNNCAAAINGALPVTDTSATIPTVTQSRLGCDGTNYLNGWLAKIMYWPQRITDAEVQAFSKQS